MKCEYCGNEWEKAKHSEGCKSCYGPKPKTVNGGQAGTPAGGWGGGGGGSARVIIVGGGGGGGGVMKPGGTK